MSGRELSILLEETLMLAPYWMPARAKWITSDIEIELATNPTPTTVRERPTVALVDSLVASRLLNDHVIIRDHGAVWSRSSMLTMVTSERPDGIEAATVAAPDVSIVGRAIAELVIPEFYGITIEGWSEEHRKVDQQNVLITEGPAALLPSDDDRHYHEDLGRAWFLMTDTPFVSHVCLAPSSLIDRDPANVQKAVSTLDDLLAASDEHRREVRRNISRDHGIDRDLVTDILAEMAFRLDGPALSGLETLYARAGVTVPGGLDARWKSQIQAS